VLGHIVNTTVANSPTRYSVRLPTRLLSHPRAGIGTVRAIGKPVITYRGVHLIVIETPLRMTAYSIDVRQKIRRACERQLGSQRPIADVFGVSLAFEKVLRQHRTTGDLAPTPHAGAQKPRLDAAAQAVVHGWWVTSRMRPWRNWAQGSPLT
jgi:hypothetical protein